MIKLIETTTLAATSRSFYVARGDIVGLSSVGLTGAEEIVVQRLQVDYSWADVADTVSVMTAAAPNTTVSSSGRYRVVKGETSSPAGVNAD